MRDNEQITNIYNHPDFMLLDAVALEREARRLRAEAMAESLRGFGRWIARRIAARRTARAGQTA